MPKKIKIKNSVPHLLSAVCRHKDCPAWLDDEIWKAVNSYADIPPTSPEQFAVMLAYAPTRRDEQREKESKLPEIEPTTAPEIDSETDNLALLLSGVLNNPRLPEKLKDEFKDALTEFTNDLPTNENIEFFSVETSPEYLARLFKIAEAEDE